MDPFRRRYLLYFIALVLLVSILAEVSLAYHVSAAFNVASVVVSAFILLVIGGLIVRNWIHLGFAAIRPPILAGQVLVLAALILFLGLAIVRIG